MASLFFPDLCLPWFKVPNTHDLWVDKSALVVNGKVHIELAQFVRQDVHRIDNSQHFQILLFRKISCMKDIKID